jgi:hypothetical protein
MHLTPKFRATIAILGIVFLSFHNKFFTWFWGLHHDKRVPLGIIFVGYPLAWIFLVLATLTPHLFSPLLRQLYMIISGHLIIYSSYGIRPFIYTYFTLALVYGFMAWMFHLHAKANGEPVSRAWLWASPIFVLILLAQLCVVHWDRFIGDMMHGHTFVAFLMMNCIKWMQMINHTLDSVIKPSEALKSRQRNHRIQVFHKILPLPYVIAYIFYFGGLITGPICTMEEFSTLIFAKDSTHRSNQETEESRIEYFIYQGMKKALYSVLFVIIYDNLGSVITIEQYLSDSPEGYLYHPNWLLRFCILHIIGFVWRCKAYSAWLLAEGAIVSSGMILHRMPQKKALDSEKSKVFCNSDPMVLEFKTYSARDYSTSWNIRVQEWLYSDVYIRILDLIGQNHTGLATFFTFSVSAIWHGIYPGYLMAMATISIYVIAERRFLKKIQKSPSNGSLPPLWIRMLLGILCYMILMYSLVPFLILKWDLSLIYWGSFYYIGHIIPIVIIIML